MLRNSAKIVSVALLLSCILVLSGCQTQKEVPEPDFSNAKQVAELATFECYSHNVAKRVDPGFWFDIGKREVWFEYDSMVSYGIDANKVEIGKPHQVGEDLVVTVKIPNAQVFGRPALVNDTIVVSAEKRGFLVFTDLAADQKKEAINNAQNDLEEKAANDASMLEQASNRGRELIRSYVTNVGDALGQKYVVEFETVS